MRRLPVHMVEAKELSPNLRKLSTCNAQTKETVTVARMLSVSGGMSPTRNSSPISSQRMILSQSSRSRRSCSESVTPAMKASTGTR